MRLIDADALKEKAFGKRGGLIHTEDIDNAPTVQPTVADCWGCNCPKMERLKEQKTFSEMVHLHDTETHDKRAETHACDLISRQAAIDDAETVNPSMLLDVEWVKNWVKTLPSAQPELIRCKDCKRHNIGIGDFWEDGNTRHWFWKDEACPLVQHRGKAQGHEFDYQFCAYAERRTDEL